MGVGKQLCTAHSTAAPPMLNSRAVGSLGSRGSVMAERSLYPRSADTKPLRSPRSPLPSPRSPGPAPLPSPWWLDQPGRSSLSRLPVGRGALWSRLKPDSPTSTDKQAWNCPMPGPKLPHNCVLSDSPGGERTRLRRDFWEGGWEGGLSYQNHKH